MKERFFSVKTLYPEISVTDAEGDDLPADRSRRPTIKDVAQLADVSSTTVSVVLNDQREGIRVPESTRERVHRAAAELGYTPNVLARNLRTRASSTIGFLSDEVTTTPFAVSMLAAPRMRLPAAATCC